MAVSLSISIIGHNEADHLRRLLPTLAWADEIIYVDCESADGSCDVAREFTDKVFQRPNDMSININKAFGIHQATCDWVFYMDPDERLPQDLVAEIRNTIAGDTEFAAFSLPRRNHFFGRWLKRGSMYPDRQLRLFKRGAADFANRHIHEKLTVNGRIGRLRHAFDHHPYERLSQMIAKFNRDTNAEAGYLHRDGVSRKRLSWIRLCITKPLIRFTRRYIFKLGFLDGLPGLIAPLADALSWPVRWFKARELDNPRPRP